MSDPQTPPPGDEPEFVPPAGEELSRRRNEPIRTIHRRSRPATGEAAEIPVIQPGDPAMAKTDSKTPELNALIDEMGAIFYNTIHDSWLSAADVDEALTRTFDAAEKALAQYKRLAFSIRGNEMTVNKEPYIPEGSSATTFLSHLSGMEAGHFTINHGVDKLELSRFIGVVTLQRHELAEQGGFYEAVNHEGFEHIAAVKVRIQEVSEDETVISQQELEAKLQEERAKAEDAAMAMLSGETDPDSEASLSGIHTVASDSDVMAGLIMQAAGKDADLVAQGNGRAVVGCLRRAFNGLMKDPSIKTQMGKKALMKTLRDLEKQILVQMDDEHDDDAKGAVTEAIEEMRDEIQMDAIAEEYTKRLNAIESSEKRILRFIKSHGLDQAQDSDLALKLSEAGLDVSGWHALLAKSKTGTAEDRALGESEDGTMAAVGNLATLLDQLMTDVEATPTEATPPEEQADRLTQHLTEVNAEVQQLTAVTEHKIHDLVAEIQADLATPEGAEAAAPQRLSKRKLVKALAEIVQEICQPLSVVGCSLNILTEKMLGELTDPQMDTLKLANESVQKIHKLVDAMVLIAGMPTELDPDSTLQRAIYEQS